MRFGIPTSCTAVLLQLLLAIGAPAQEPAGGVAARAYEALADGALEVAVLRFQKAIEEQPANAALRKDFAYTLLKIGDTESAREQFREAVRLVPADSHSALEYAFLCHETGKQGEAWAVFRSLRKTRNPEHRATARNTFAKLDADLRARIARLEAVLGQNPEDEGSHAELARTAAIRNEFAKAAVHFEKAYLLKQEYPELLLALADSAEKAGDPEKARAAILLASRATSAFVAEQARAMLPGRYPYLYEFENALALQPGHSGLRREMAFFLVSLGRRGQAIKGFRDVLAVDPEDALASAQLGFLLLEEGARIEAVQYLRAALSASDEALKARVLQALSEQPAGETGSLPLPQRAPETTPTDAAGPHVQTAPANAVATPLVSAEANAPPEDAPEFLSRNAKQDAASARAMGKSSYESGFIPDAVRYYRQAHELDPTDFDTMLRLGYSLNMEQKDQEAVQWLFLAARSPDAAIATEATKALRNLTAPAPSGAAQAQLATAATGVVTSFWAMPMHSTRWQSTFAYSQVKAELQLPQLPLVPYLSLRFVGDTTGAVGAANPQFLSENAFILGGGLRTRPKNGFLLWAEAGSAMAYLGTQRNQTSAFAPDYRGGLSQMKLVGPILLDSQGCWFGEKINDLV